MNRGRMEEGKKKKKKKWVGKHRILVKSWSTEGENQGVRSEWFVVNLKKNKIVMKNPHAVWSDSYFNSTAVLHKGTLYVLNISVRSFTHCLRPTPPIGLNEEQDYIHYPSEQSDTCISTLDLAVTPPVWSNWTPGPKMIFERWLFPSFSLVVGNNIFAFNGTGFHSRTPEVYQIGGGGDDDDSSLNKWESVPFPADFTTEDPDWQPISDPKNNRFIAYFGNQNSLYAYHPNTKEWKLLCDHLSGADVFKASLIADQVVVDNLILCLDIDEQFFSAYDILNNKWLDVVDGFSDLDPDFGASCKLVHLGDDILCLAIPDMEYQGCGNVLLFHTFSVKCVKERVHLTPLSFHPIFFDDNIHFIADTFIPF